MRPSAIVKVAITVCLVALAMPGSVGAESGAERVAAAKEMMAVAGVAKQFDEVMPLLAAQLAESFVAMAPDKAHEIRDVFSRLPAKFSDRKGDLIDQIAALYAARLTLEELQGVTTFYKSPLGIKFIAVQPQVSKEALVLGQRWGADIGREIQAEARKELKKRGIDL